MKQVLLNLMMNNLFCVGLRMLVLLVVNILIIIIITLYIENIPNMYNPFNTFLKKKKINVHKIKIDIKTLRTYAMKS